MLLFLTLSCKDNSVGPQPPPPEPGDLISDFPTRVGLTWTYAIHDSSFDDSGQLLLARTDSLVITVISRTIVSDTHHVAKWLYAFSDTTDTVTVDILPSVVTMTGAIRIYSSPYAETRDAEYMFPLSVGRSWGSTYYLGGDTSAVLEQDTMTVSGGTFPNAFHIWRNSYAIGPVSGILLNIWFVPKTGFVRSHQKENLLGPGNHRVALELQRHNMAP